MITFLNVRKDTLKSLNFAEYIHGNRWFQSLQTCKNLEELGISYAENMDDNAVDAISQLHNLKILKLNFAYTYINMEIDCNFKGLFKKGNLENLLHIDLNCCSNINNEVLKTISTGNHIYLVNLSIFPPKDYYNLY